MAFRMFDDGGSDRQIRERGARRKPFMSEGGGERRRVNRTKPVKPEQQMWRGSAPPPPPVGDAGRAAWQDQARQAATRQRLDSTLAQGTQALLANRPMEDAATPQFDMQALMRLIQGGGWRF